MIGGSRRPNFATGQCASRVPSDLLRRVLGTLTHRRRREKFDERGGLVDYHRDGGSVATTLEQVEGGAMDCLKGLRFVNPCELTLGYT